MVGQYVLVTTAISVDVLVTTNAAAYESSERATSGSWKKRILRS